MSRRVHGKRKRLGSSDAEKKFIWCTKKLRARTRRSCQCIRASVRVSMPSAAAALSITTRPCTNFQSRIRPATSESPLSWI